MRISADEMLDFNLVGLVYHIDTLPVDKGGRGEGAFQSFSKVLLETSQPAVAEKNS
jgi:hypothetical protein